MRNGMLYPPPVPARPTSGRGFGFWLGPAPAPGMVPRPLLLWRKPLLAANGGLIGTLGEAFGPAAVSGALIPTPRAVDARGSAQWKSWEEAMASGYGWLLTSAVLLPTPGAAEGRQVHLAQAVRLGQGGGRLNPAWVEWLMGWPIGWTDCAPSGTGRFRRWLRRHSCCSGSAPD
jgi:hypothetical protein